MEEDVPIRDETELQNFHNRPRSERPRIVINLLRPIRQEFHGEKMVSYSIRDTFGTSETLMGLNEYLIAFRERPQMIRKLYDMTTDWVIEVAKEGDRRPEPDMIILNSDPRFTRTGPGFIPT